MNRFDKLDYLLETCSSEFIKECQFLQELVSWMTEDDFDAFYKRLCATWAIKTPEELDEAMK
mgnify:CR=1 FL=1